ncbi:MAG: thioredoxin domain-containing protein [Saprospiraceae bacterium]
MNRLQFEKSPYLLQHKDNPVDWYAWGSEALERAVKENKPILLSIGYSSCHWCHVMERESFTDERVAQFMNLHFVNIKLDREERPDLDKIYMDAVVALSGSGGWPLNCFLLPDKRPFYGGTYFPPTSIHQRPSWIQILEYILRIYNDQRAEVEEQAGRLTDFIRNSGNTLLQLAGKPIDDLRSDESIGKRIFSHLKNRFDRTWGGFGGAPKFPATMSQRYLLDYYFYSGDQDAKDHVMHSLTTMARAGIYDQLAGGFARYATDKEWNIPHFEKMLYDNAQLISLYSAAYKLKPSGTFKRVVYETIRWLISDMKSPLGGFYCAIDADSEHVEGKYYVWTVDELVKILSEEEFKLLNESYAIEEEGNWEDPFHPDGLPKNILWVNKEVTESTLDSSELETIKSKLLTVRRQRVPPLTDTKIILSWNALLCLGLLEAFDAFDDDSFLAEALHILQFIDLHLKDKNKFKHQFESNIPPMLDDLAYYITACIHAYRSTGDTVFVDKASAPVTDVLKNYFNPSTKSFSYSISQDDLISSVNDLYDNTMPSASGIMAYNLVQLGRILNRPEWEELGNEIIRNLLGAIIRYPESLSHWASLAINQMYGWMEVKTGYNGFGQKVLRQYMPQLIMHRSDDVEISEISFCHNFSCEMPVKSYEEFRLLLDKHYHTS